MVIGGVLEQVPVADIELDRTNPRIRKFLEMYPEAPTAEQMYLALNAAGDEEGESSTSFQKLKNSIQTNGGIIHPVILNRRADGLCLKHALLTPPHRPQCCGRTLLKLKGTARRIRFAP